MTTRILVVDNYDSFVWTIAGYLAQLGAQCDVLRNDAVTAAEAEDYDGVLLSPGPGTPAEAGVSPDMVRYCAATRTPLLGVCLGHQALGEVFGGTVAHAPELMHGKTSQVHHDRAAPTGRAVAVSGTGWANPWATTSRRSWSSSPTGMRTARTTGSGFRAG